MKRKRRLKVRPVPYKHTGSTFDQDGIRITGTEAFINAILSRLTELLVYEGDETRLQLSYKQATDKENRRSKTPGFATSRSTSAATKPKWPMRL